MDGLDVRFVEGRVYSRTKEITGRFGGTPQGGIAHSAQTPAVFIFTGEEGEQYGYTDAWDDAGRVFTYTGEGQVGDMQFVRGNKAIRDHVEDGRSLHLFTKVSREGGLYRYIGEMQCASTSVVRGPDRNGNERNIIQFELFRLGASGGVDDVAGQSPSDTEAPSDQQEESSLHDLRRRAYRAIKPPGSKVLSGTPRAIRERSRAVVEYVLARAAGLCESCSEAAPFVRADGRPYLEAHHTQRLSDEGLDSPLFVGAICPTCHRRIHYGIDGSSVNEALRIVIRDKESRAP